MVQNWGRSALRIGTILTALFLAPTPAPAGQSDEAPTIASTRAALFELLDACRGGDGANASALEPGWRFECPLCALLRSDDWVARRGMSPDLVIIERALVKPHREWHQLVGALEWRIRAGSSPGPGLLERFDLCWLELGILLDAATAVN